MSGSKILSLGNVCCFWLPFIAELYLELCLVESLVTLQYGLFGWCYSLWLCHLQYGLFLVVSFITVRCGLLLAASFVVLCIGSVICY